MCWLTLVVTRLSSLLLYGKLLGHRLLLLDLVLLLLLLCLLLLLLCMLLLLLMCLLLLNLLSLLGLSLSLSLSLLLLLLVQPLLNMDGQVDSTDGIVPLLQSSELGGTHARVSGIGEICRHDTILLLLLLNLLLLLL